MSEPPSLREKLKNAPFCIRPSSPTFNYLNGIDPVLLQMDREMEKVEAIDAARTAAMIKRRYAVTSYPCNPGQGHGYNKFITSNHEEVEWNEEIFQRLKEIGVLVFKNDKNEIYFYIGEMRFCTLLELVDERWNNTGCNNAGESAIFEPMKEIVMREITAELRKNFQRWKIFLEPIRSRGCLHDTFIRVLILSQTFQISIIKTLVGMLQKITDHKKDGYIEFGKKLVRSFRYITQVFDCAAIYELIFNNERISIQNWYPQLRDDFIEILPQLFTEDIHSKVVNKIHAIMVNETLSDQMNLQRGCLESLYFLVSDIDKVWLPDLLLEKIMKFEIDNIPSIFKLIFHLTDQNVQSFVHVITQIDKRLNIQELEEIDFKNERQQADKIFDAKRINVLNNSITTSVNFVIQFMQFNQNIAKISMLQFFYLEESDCSGEKEFGFFSVLLILCFYDATGNIDDIIKVLNNIINLGTIKSIKNHFERAMKNSTLLRVYARSLNAMALRFVSCSYPEITKIGCIMYKCLFLCPTIDQDSIFENLSSHIDSSDNSENSAAASTLKEIVLDPDLSLTGLKEYKVFFMKKFSHFDYNWLSHSNFSKIVFITLFINIHENIIDKRSCLDIIEKLVYCRNDKFKIVAILEYVKLLIIFQMDEAEITTFLQKAENVATYDAEITSFFYAQIGTLLKSVESLEKCPALIKFGKAFVNHVKTNILKLTSENTMFILPDLQKNNLLIPILQTVKDFLFYIGSSSSDCWNSIYFLMEADIDLGIVNDPSSDSMTKCDVLCFTSDYIRALLNMFYDCPIKTKNLAQLMKIKFKLMCKCEAQLSQVIAEGFIYRVSRLIHDEKVNFAVHDIIIQKTGNLSKNKKLKNNYDKDNEENDNKSGNDAYGQDNNIKHVKVNRLQFLWYLIPLKMDAIVSLVKAIGWSVDHGCEDYDLEYLLKMFFNALQHSLPRGWIKLPSNCGFKVGAHALPFSFEYFGDYSSFMEIIFKSVKPIFTIAEATMIVLKNKEIQTCIHVKAIDVLKICLKIFTFASTINDKALKFKEVSINYREIFVKSLINSISCSKDEDTFDKAYEKMAMYFFRYLEYLPSIESKFDLLFFLNTFPNVTSILKDKFAKGALDALFSISDESDPRKINADEKFALKIVSLYVTLRSDCEKATSVIWIVWYHFLKIYTPEIRKAGNFVIGNAWDDKDFVEAYSDKKCFYLKSVSQWHKLLFKLLNDSVAVQLQQQQSGDEMEIEYCLYCWTKCIETFYLLIAISKDPDIQDDINFLKVIVKEGHRFLSFLMQDSSSFASIVKNKVLLEEDKYRTQVLEQIKIIQCAMRLLLGIKNLGTNKDHQFHTLMMKTDAINEHFNEELAKAVETVGCKHLISFDTLKPIDLKKKADAIKIKRKSVVENEAYNVPVKRLKTATDLENRSPF